MIINFTRYPDTGWYKPIKLDMKDEKPINSFSELTGIYTLSKNQLAVSIGNFAKHDTVELSEKGLFMSRNAKQLIETIPTEYMTRTTNSIHGERIDMKIPVNEDSMRIYMDKGMDASILSNDITGFVLKEAEEYKKYLTFETYNHEYRQDAVYSDEDYLTNELAKRYSGNANDLLEFFKGSKPSKAETNDLATDMAELIKQLGKHMALGKDYYVNNHDQRMGEIPNLLKLIDHHKLKDIAPRDDINVDYYYHTSAQFSNSGKGDIFEYFSNIDITNKLTIKNGFDNAMEKYNSFFSEWSKQRGHITSKDELKADKIYETYNIMMSKWGEEY